LGCGSPFGLGPSMGHSPWNTVKACHVSIDELLDTCSCRDDVCLTAHGRDDKMNRTYACQRVTHHTSLSSLSMPQSPTDNRKWNIQHPRRPSVHLWSGRK
jgi:hypothetical protein